MAYLDNNIGGYLAKAFAEGTASHAYIVVAEKHSLSKLLNECAMVTMCHSHTVDGCDICNKIRQGVHQDVISIPQDKVKNRITCSADDHSDTSVVISEIYKRPVDSSSIARVVTIDASNSMLNGELWQNRLLKTIEEPVKGVYLYIGVTDLEGLLPTVRSRCQVLKQSRVTTQQVVQYLCGKGFTQRSSQMAAVMSNGSVTMGESLVTNNLAFSCFDIAIDIAENMLSTKQSLRYASQMVANKDNIGYCLGFLQCLLRESILYRLAPQLVTLTALQGTIDKVCQNYTLQAAEVCIETINSAKMALDKGSNLTVVVDKLLSGILEVRFRCRQ